MVVTLFAVGTILGNGIQLYILNSNWPLPLMRPDSNWKNALLNVSTFWVPSKHRSGDVSPSGWPKLETQHNLRSSLIIIRFIFSFLYCFVNHFPFNGCGVVSFFCPSFPFHLSLCLQAKIRSVPHKDIERCVVIPILEHHAELFLHMRFSAMFLQVYQQMAWSIVTTTF